MPFPLATSRKGRTAAGGIPPASLRLVTRTSNRAFEATGIERCLPTSRRPSSVPADGRPTSRRRSGRLDSFGPMSPSTLIYVLDYDSIGRPGVMPKRLHRTDCSHPLPHAIWRKATNAELKTVPPCKDCQNRE